MSFMVGMLGYVVLWPNWRTVGSLVLIAAIVHAMVMTEEEHLRDMFGPEYEQYRERVPRYLGIRKRLG